MRYLEPGQVQALLASCAQETTAGRRDYAIMILLSRLGLRAGEVAALTLEDIDWRRGEIVVRGKGNSCDRLPLPVDVGQALADYLESARPREALDRCVFVHVRAPRRGLAASSVSDAVAAASRRAGLEQTVSGPESVSSRHRRGQELPTTTTPASAPDPTPVLPSAGRKARCFDAVTE